MSDIENMSLIKDLLLCPVCFNYMVAPIRQCKTGHNFCNECFYKIKRCPECRATKSDARAFKLEAVSSMLIFPCRNNDVGCNHKDRGENISLHEKHCRFGTISCPFMKYDSCYWQGNFYTLEAHCSRKHKSNFYSKEKQKFLAKNFLNITNNYYIYVIIHAFSEFFRLTWELDDITGITKWSVMYMGTIDNAKKFSFRIEFDQPSDPEYSDYSRNLIWISPCGILPDNENEKFLEHNYVMIHRDLLNTLCDENGDLNYTVRLYESRHRDQETDSNNQCSESDEDLDVRAGETNHSNSDTE